MKIRFGDDPFIQKVKTEVENTKQIADLVWIKEKLLELEK